MGHWLDHLARDVAGGRVSRRQVVLGGARVFAGGTLVGGGSALFRRLPAAQARGCSQISEECRALSSQVQATAQAACAQELPANRALCNHQASGAGVAALIGCLNQNRANECGPCKYCVSGECTPYCKLACAPCEASSGACVDTCLEDHYCDGRVGAQGACAPKCPDPCSLYDPSTGGCKRCADANPCMACIQGRCQSNCPDPGDFCDADGTCRRPSQCTAAEREKCCTASETRHCENQGTATYLSAVSSCRGPCAHKNSAPCKTCATAVAKATLTAFTGCTATTCLTVPPTRSREVDRLADGERSTAATNLSAPRHRRRSHGPVARLASAPTCNAEELGTCRDEAEQAFIIESAKCTGECGELSPECSDCIETAMAALANDLAACVAPPNGCPGLTFCTDEDICCGGFEIACGGECCGQLCTNGVCCAANEVGCGGTCCANGICCNGACIKDSSSNPAHCGACDHSCAPGEICVSGACSKCAAGETQCGGQCTNTQTDPANCGGCGHPCGPGETCQAGVCSTCGGQSCGPPNTCCSDQCVDLETDAANCGACGNACASGMTCQSGTCACPSGEQICNNQCVNMQTDPNCGSCGNNCGAAGATCCSGQCVNLQVANSDCGACGTTCPPGFSCQGGVCVCGGQSCGAPNGCCNNQCVNVQTDVSNCGSCGNACTGGDSCQGGVCGCYSPSATCGNQCTDLQNDPRNCGSCGNACPVAPPGEAPFVCCSGQCCLFQQICFFGACATPG